MLRNILAALVAALVMASCSVQSAAPKAVKPADSQTVSTSPVSGPSPTRRIEVTQETVCFQIKNAVFDVVRLVAKVAEDPTLASIDVDEVRSLAETFEHASSVAPPAMTALLDAQAAVLRDIQDVVESGVNTTLEFEDFKSANIDLVVRCDYFPGGIGEMPRQTAESTAEG